MRHLGSVRDSLAWCCAWATFQAESSNSAFGGAFLAPLLGCWKGLLAGKASGDGSGGRAHRSPTRRASDGCVPLWKVTLQAPA
jgi:hypothetical protein